MTKDNASWHEKHRSALSIPVEYTTMPVIVVAKNTKQEASAILPLAQVKNGELQAMMDIIGQDLSTMKNSGLIYNILYLPALDTEGESIPEGTPSFTFAVDHTNIRGMREEVVNFFTPLIEQHAKVGTADYLAAALTDKIRVQPKLSGQGFNIQVKRLAGEFGNSVETHGQWRERTGKIADIVLSALPGGEAILSGTSFNNGRIVINTNGNNEVHKTLSELSLQMG